MSPKYTGSIHQGQITIKLFILHFSFITINKISHAASYLVNKGFFSGSACLLGVFGFVLIKLTSRLGKLSSLFIYLFIGWSLFPFHFICERFLLS